MLCFFCRAGLRIFKVRAPGVLHCKPITYIQGELCSSTLPIDVVTYQGSQSEVSQSTATLYGLTHQGPIEYADDYPGYHYNEQQSAHAYSGSMQDFQRPCELNMYCYTCMYGDFQMHD